MTAILVPPGDHPTSWTGPLKMTPGDGEAVATGVVGVGNTRAVSVADGAADLDGDGDGLPDGPTVGAVRNAPEASSTTTTKPIPITATGAPKLGRRREDTTAFEPAVVASRDPGRTVS